jgi:hypothetical protein
MVKPIKPPLRAVKASERAPQRKRPLSVVEAATRGSHEELLVALRLRLASAIGDPNAHPRDLAALACRLLEISREIEATSAGGEEDQVGRAAATADETWQGI